MYLETEGFKVDLADNGDEGLRQAVSLPGYDLIILDANLPGRNGFEVLREMRVQGVSTPVLMLTGLGAHEDKMRGFELGADDYLTKPFASEELLARIKRHRTPDADRARRDRGALPGRRPAGRSFSAHC